MNDRSSATLSQWVEGARPRTLPAAVAPVLAGTGVAAYVADVVWGKALLALGVSLALQIGVNYANDYSDGICWAWPSRPRRRGGCCSSASPPSARPGPTRAARTPTATVRSAR